MPLTSGNKFDEEANPKMGALVNTVQGNIKLSTYIVSEMRDSKERLFKIINNEKKNYINTLLEGEDNGHCKGIKKRLDPTVKFRILQQVARQKQACEEFTDTISLRKKARDEKKLRDKRERV
jgi:hypothetical protein